MVESYHGKAISRQRSIAGGKRMDEEAGLGAGWGVEGKIKGVTPPQG